MRDELDMTGSAVIVTGGAKGVGLGITETYLDAGADVVICGRTEPEEPVTAGGRTADFIATDVRDTDQITAAVASTIDRYGRLDVLVNNAGGAPFAEAATASPRFSEKIIALNLLAPLNFSQAANAAMQDQDDGGSIVNIGSVSGLRPSPGTAAYGAAKAGLHNLTTTLAVEWAPKVRVNCVVGGLIRTEQSDLHYGDAEGVKRVEATIPLGRLAVPRDVGQACLYLSSPMASYVTGAQLVLHGGGERPAFLEAANGG